MRRQRRSLMLALLGLLVLSAGALQDFGIHTDDGCRTEVHCLLCRAQRASAATLADGRVALTPLATVGEVVVASATAPPSLAPRPASSRGPPQAS